VLEVVNLFRASVVDYAPDALVIEVTGDTARSTPAARARAVRHQGARQSGLLAIGRGGKSITERVLRG
jgi:acetolactate synthase-1/3 small subunit